MGMSKKDYVAIAAEINDVQRGCPADGTALQQTNRGMLMVVTRRLMRVFARDNHLFRENTFWEACGFKMEEL